MSGVSKQETAKKPWGCLVSFTVHQDINLVDDCVWLGRGEVRMASFSNLLFFRFFENIAQACHPNSRYLVSEISKRHCSVARKNGRVTVTDTSSNGTFINGKLLGRGATVSLNHEDVLSLLVPSADCEAFNPEQVGRAFVFGGSPSHPPLQSVMYRFHNLMAPPAAPKLNAAPKFLGMQKSSPNKGNRMFLSTESLPLGAKASGPLLSPETSAPEDFVRIIKVNSTDEVLRQLHLALKTRKDSWLRLFIEIGGLDQLADVLAVKLRSQLDDLSAVYAVKCIKVTGVSIRLFLLMSYSRCW